MRRLDDLGTPLVLGVANMLAPQAYLRITSVGIDDPLGYVISFMMIGFSIVSLWLSARVLKGKDYSTTQKGGSSLQRRKLGKLQSVLAYGWILLVLLVVLSPHLGILILSLAQVWSFSVLPDAYTLQHYTAVVSDAGGMMSNTLLYCGLSAPIDVILGTAIAYLILRTKLAGRQWLDYAASAAIGQTRLELKRGARDRRAAHLLAVVGRIAGLGRRLNRIALRSDARALLDPRGVLVRREQLRGQGHEQTALELHHRVDGERRLFFRAGFVVLSERTL